MLRVYLASPLGVSHELKSYLEKIKASLHQLGYEVFDPWEQPFAEATHDASGIVDHDERLAAFVRLAKEIGATNENGIRESDILLAVLDGVEVDSGTAAEMGFAAVLVLDASAYEPTGGTQASSGFLSICKSFTS